MALFFLLFLGTLSAATLGSDMLNELKFIRGVVPRAKSRIINGQEVVPHSHKYQVALWINGNSFCGGVLISPDFVLTAAHCGVEVFSKVDVILGAHNITNSNESTQVRRSGTKVIVHADYNKTSFANDISLIKLNASVQYNQYIQSVKLPLKSDSALTYDGENPTAIGWGLMHDVASPSTKDLSSVLMGVSLPVLNLTECTFYFNSPNVTYVTPGNVCTSGYRNRGACNGDSGGALILKDVLIGLTSFGDDKCEACNPSVFTKVAKFVDWIALNSDVKSLL